MQRDVEEVQVLLQSPQTNRSQSFMLLQDVLGSFDLAPQNAPLGMTTALHNAVIVLAHGDQGDNFEEKTTQGPR